MKHYTKYLLAAALVWAGYMFTTPAQAKNEVVPQVYMFGFAASFNDTIVHFTEVQTVDSVWIEQKKKFLLGRDNYSYQLQNYLTNHKNMPNRTCVVVFDLNKKKLEKKYLKLKRKYDDKKANNFDVRIIATQDFRFQTIDIGNVTEEEAQPAAKPAKPKKQDRRKPKPEGRKSR